MMVSTFQIIITPDPSLNIASVTYSTSLTSIEDFQAFLWTFQNNFKLGSNAQPAEIMQSWVNAVMIDTFNSVVSWVRVQKESAIVVETPTLILTSN